MQNQLTAIIGAQWGDEGKGKVTDFFAHAADYVVRFQGGNNAGHTLVVGDQTYKLHLIPSGVLYPQAISIVGNGTLIDPKVMIEEIKKLKERGINPNLKISQRAHIIMPYHITMDEGLSRHQGELAAGSTKRGIAPVSADKVYRHGIRMGDLLEPELFKEKLNAAYNFNVNIIKKVFELPFEQTLESIYNEYLAYGKELESYVADTEIELYQAYKQGKKILFEGAQAMSLDPDHGMYPHTTSTNNIAGYIEVGTGVGFNTTKKIVGVMKAYISRVGNSPFTTEIIGDEGEALRKKGNEYGTTTGRPRRVGWLDLVQIRQSVRVSGLTDLAIMKIDILSDFPEIKICVAYDCNGERVTEMPASLTKMRIAKPIYETLPGWKAIAPSDVDQMVKKGFNGLPQEIKNFITFIEKQVGCPVSIISIGPERHQTIVK